MNSSTIIKYGAVFATVSGIAGGSWAALEFTEIRPVILKEYRIAQEQTYQQLEEMSKAVLHLKFQNLMEQRERGGLTFNDQQELCRISRVLGYVGVPGCP